jgi:uncharacterized HAD superfamily protein
MTIALDADDVLFPFVPHFCKFLNWKYNLNLAEKDVHTYQMWKVYKVPMQQAIDDIDEFSETPAFKRIIPYKNSVEGVKQLKELDTLALVTSRRSRYKQYTENQIDNFFPGLFSQVLLGNSFPKSGKEITKRELCNKANAWLMIEDSKSYALDIAKDIPVIVPAKPWNLETYGKNILRLNEQADALWIRIPKVARELDRDPYCLLQH